MATVRIGGWVPTASLEAKTEEIMTQAGLESMVA